MLDVCCFTGHRHIPEQGAGDLSDKVRHCIDWMYKEKGVRTFYAGGCKGFDALASRMVLEYRETHPEVRLIVVVPYADQSRGWSQEEKDEYERIKAMASKVICLAGHYYRGCMQKRNRYMVDHSSLCICYLTKSDGGTVSTVRYAKARNISVYNLANRTEKWTVE